jgi:hypothetical protein
VNFGIRLPAGRQGLRIADSESRNQNPESKIEMQPAQKEKGYGFLISIAFFELSLIMKRQK